MIDSHAQTVFPLRQYIYVIGGILISLALPILRRMLPLPKPLLQPSDLKPILIIGAFSILTGLLVVAFGGAHANDWEWYTALLAGYAWDSTLQKIAGS